MPTLLKQCLFDRVRSPLHLQHTKCVGRFESQHYFGTAKVDIQTYIIQDIHLVDLPSKSMSPMRGWKGNQSGPFWYRFDSVCIVNVVYGGLDKDGVSMIKVYNGHEVMSGKYGHIALYAFQSQYTNTRWWLFLWYLERD